jgi:hypothetical protein
MRLVCNVSPSVEDAVNDGLYFPFYRWKKESQNNSREASDEQSIPRDNHFEQSAE